MPKAPTHPDDVLGRALAKVASALNQVRSKLAAGTINETERTWAKVMVQGGAGLLAPATEVDLADHLWSLAQVHNERVAIARKNLKGEARAKGLVVVPVKRLPYGKAETAEFMRGKRKGQKLVEEGEASARGALMREGMIALDARFALVDFSGILGDRDGKSGPIPLLQNVVDALDAVPGLKVSIKQLKREQAKRPTAKRKPAKR
jgi:hypothetical protein